MVCIHLRELERLFSARLSRRPRLRLRLALGLRLSLRLRLRLWLGECALREWRGGGDGLRGDDEGDEPFFTGDGDEGLARRRSSWGGETEREGERDGDRDGERDRLPTGERDRERLGDEEGLSSEGVGDRA